MLTDAQAGVEFSSHFVIQESWLNSTSGVKRFCLSSYSRQFLSHVLNHNIHAMLKLFKPLIRVWPSHWDTPSSGGTAGFFLFASPIVVSLNLSIKLPDKSQSDTGIICNVTCPAVPTVHQLWSLLSFLSVWEAFRFLWQISWLWCCCQETSTTVLNGNYEKYQAIETLYDNYIFHC